MIRLDSIVCYVVKKKFSKSIIKIRVPITKSGHYIRAYARPPLTVNTITVGNISPFFRAIQMTVCYYTQQ